MASAIGAGQIVFVRGAGSGVYAIAAIRMTSRNTGHVGITGRNKKLVDWHRYGTAEVIHWQGVTFLEPIRNGRVQRTPHITRVRIT